MTTKTWTEALVQRLVRRNRGRDPRFAIETYANKLRTDAEQTELPIDVELIASLKGIRNRNSAITRARSSGRLERQVESLPGAKDAGRFVVEAKPYGFAGRERVLAVARAMS
jgi:hypothetical protein